MEINKWLTHGAWAAVAIAAFALGGIGRNTPTGSGGGGGTSSSPSPRQQADAPELSAVPGTTGGGGAASPSGSRNLAPSSAETIALNPAEIESVSVDAFTDPNPLTRSLAFSRLLEGLTPENAELVLQSLKDGGADRDQWRLFLYAWGSKDGAGAMDYATSNLEGDRLRQFQGEVLTGWASRTPDDAIAWVAGIDDPEQRERYNYSLIGGLADHDISYATDYTYQLAASGDRNASRYLDTVASEQMRKAGLDGALVWAEGLPDGSLKGSALDRVAGNYVGKDPEAAAAWAAQFAGVDWGVRVIEEIGDEWAERDPRASVGWLETLPQGAGRSEGTYSAFREWAQRDAMAASQHLLAMPDSVAKDHAVRGLSRTIASRDPESAIAWANTIGSDKLRTETLTRAAQEWYRRDRVAAAEWLATSGLPSDAQQQVTNPPRDRSKDTRRRG